MARGNAVLRAKRVTGPSAQSLLITACRLERCSVKGCNNAPLRSTTVDGTIRRHCVMHLTDRRTAGRPVSTRASWTPPWFGA